MRASIEVVLPDTELEGRDVAYCLEERDEDATIARRGGMIRDIPVRG